MMMMKEINNQQINTENNFQCDQKLRARERKCWKRTTRNTSQKDRKTP